MMFNGHFGSIFRRGRLADHNAIAEIGSGLLFQRGWVQFPGTAKPGPLRRAQISFGVDEESHLPSSGPTPLRRPAEAVPRRAHSRQVQKGGLRKDRRFDRSRIAGLSLAQDPGLPRGIHFWRALFTDSQPSSTHLSRTLFLAGCCSHFSEAQTSVRDFNYTTGDYISLASRIPSSRPALILRPAMDLEPEYSGNS
jgi:hypothetical protein